ncbi:MAG: hypothetical protein Q4B92_04570 [Ruminococcus sp.]|nr:hypothetical protein [Ruminococcus sp.]
MHIMLLLTHNLCIKSAPPKIKTTPTESKTTLAMRSSLRFFLEAKRIFHMLTAFVSLNTATPKPRHNPDNVIVITPK